MLAVFAKGAGGTNGAGHWSMEQLPTGCVGGCLLFLFAVADTGQNERVYGRGESSQDNKGGSEGRSRAQGTVCPVLPHHLRPAVNPLPSAQPKAVANALSTSRLSSPTFGFVANIILQEKWRTFTAFKGRRLACLPSQPTSVIAALTVGKDEGTASTQPPPLEGQMSLALATSLTHVEGTAVAGVEPCEPSLLPGHCKDQEGWRKDPDTHTLQSISFSVNPSLQRRLVQLCDACLLRRSKHQHAQWSLLPGNRQLAKELQPFVYLQWKLRCLFLG